MPGAHFEESNNRPNSDKEQTNQQKDDFHAHSYDIRGPCYTAPYKGCNCRSKFLRLGRFRNGFLITGVESTLRLPSPA